MSEVKQRFILIVDDQPVVADTLALVLRQSKYLAVACHNAAAAITIVRAVLPDVLLCDVVLGNASGIEVAAAIHRFAPDCRIFLMSGNNASSEMLERAKNDGTDFPIFAKPIPPRDLLAAIEKAIAVSPVARVQMPARLAE